MKKVLALTTVAMLVGCASNNPSQRAEDYNAKLANSNKVIEVEKTSPKVFTYPQWYESLLVQNGFISVSATDISTDPNFAVDKAMMNAKREIAIYISSITSNVSKDYTKEYNNTEIDRNRVTSQATKIVTPNIKLAGVTRERVLIQKEGEYYRAFVRVHMPLSNASAGRQFDQRKPMNIDQESKREFNQMK